MCRALQQVNQVEIDCKSLNKLPAAGHMHVNLLLPLHNKIPYSGKVWWEESLANLMNCP